MNHDKRSASSKRPRLVQRAQVAPGPLGDLKNLLYQVYLEAGAPSLDQIAAMVAADSDLPGAPSRDTIHRCISSPELPASQADAVSIVVALARAAGLEGDGLARQLRRLSIQATLYRPVGQMISRTDPFALEVHRAVTVDRADAAGVSPLPTYVPRKHDEILAGIVSEVVNGRSRLVMLVGDSSTGKTRACWEAIQRFPADWRLWNPIEPTYSEGLLNGLPDVRGRTVVWLNEVQRYLLNPSNSVNERIAAGLRALLDDPDRGPVLVIGTAWPEVWGELTWPGRRGEDEGKNAQSRTLLTGNDLCVPNSFDGASLEAARCSGDGRLVLAAESAKDGEIIQYLAGGPALQERYRTAPPAARALIEAAMDARRLGHGPALPIRLLETVAEGYLTELQWDSLADDWFARALAYVTEPLRGACRVLTVMRPRRSRPMETEPQVRLSDYLEQQGRRARSAARVPAAMWDGLLEQAKPAERLGIAREAYGRGLLRLAFRFCESADRADKHLSAALAADILHFAGRPAEALPWAAKAEESRADDLVSSLWDMGGAGRMIRILRDLGRQEEAVEWAKREAEAGDSFSLGMVEFLLDLEGRGQEATEWLKSRGDGGDAYAAWRVAQRLLNAEFLEEAFSWFQRAATMQELSIPVELLEAFRHEGRLDDLLDWLLTLGDDLPVETVRLTAEVLWEAGRGDAALDWFRRAGDLGDGDAETEAANRLREAGRVEEALAWLRASVAAEDDRGSSFEDVRGGALWMAIDILWKTGRTDDALSWLERRAAVGDRRAPLTMGLLLRVEGRVEEAIPWYRIAARVGNSDALEWIVHWLEREGRLREAMDWVRPGAEANNVKSARKLADLLDAEGRSDEAIEWYWRAFEAGDVHALSRVVSGLAGRGTLTSALAELGLQSRAGSSLALRRGAELLWEGQGLEAAVSWLKSLYEAGVTEAAVRAAELLDDCGETGEALVWFRHAADAGNIGYRERGAGFLRSAGRFEEALAWYQEAAAVGEGPVLHDAVEALSEAGRTVEGEALKRWGWEPDGSVSEPWKAPPPSSRRAAGVRDGQGA